MNQDTAPQIEAFLVEGYARMSTAEKATRVRELTRAVQQMALLRLREQYPEATERELHLHLASLWLDRSIMLRAFGWDPEVHGY